MDRRGNETGILNPTSKTLDHHHLHHNHQPNKDSNPDPDPGQPTGAPVAGSSNSRPPPPPPLPLPPLPLPEPQPTTSAPVRYRECLKNHAANMGSHVVDGCGEFMSSGEEGTPEALKCAACECHRSFHRRETDGESPAGGNCYYTYNPNPNRNRNRNNVNRTTIYPAPAPAPAQLYRYSHGPSTGLNPNPNPPVMMAFGSRRGAPAESSSEDLNNMFQSNAGAQPGVQPSFLGPKKRFRSKFSREQKDRMQEFAEKMGWKMQKQDDEEVQQFCNELGLKRQVFKVWMHNNKQAMKKKQL